MTDPTTRDPHAGSVADGLVTMLGRVPRSARWILPTLAAAFRGTDGSTLEPKLRMLAAMRVCAVDRSPYWRSQFEQAVSSVGITPDEIQLVGSDEWETAPAFTDRERAAIMWADRIAKRLARRDGAAYRLVREQCSDEELVELTAIASLAAMADRITNALRISPEPAIGITADRGSIDPFAEAWRSRMFDDVTSWKETVAP
jgi:alkylhydroperoxidase family enzyme